MRKPVDDYEYRGLGLLLVSIIGTVFLILGGWIHTISEVGTPIVIVMYIIGASLFIIGGITFLVSWVNGEIGVDFLFEEGKKE